MSIGSALRIGRNHDVTITLIAPNDADSLENNGSHMTYVIKLSRDM